MADPTIDTQEQQPQEETLQPGIQFEEIRPWNNQEGDTGLSARLKLKRNFDKIKTWLDQSGYRFLSRLFNDIAHGHITFEQGLNTLFAITDTLRSNDFTGEGLFDKGFGVWNETDPVTGATYSHAIFDFLTVRLKSFFALLEIREISYVGGNYVFSPAGSKIYHVEWMTEDDQIIDKKTGFILDTDTPGVLHHFRCWFYSDDGTTATMNKWQVGDQAQHRTFDIDAGVHENVQNRFYWRLVKTIGKSVIPTLVEGQEGYGKEFQYVDLSNVSGEHAINSSGSAPDNTAPVIAEDYPEAGDSIVQIGNWTNSDRQGIFYLQVVGDLAFYMYEGVGTRHFEIPDPTVRISPKLGNIFKGTFISTDGDDNLEDIIMDVISRLNDVQQQADKRFDIWFGAYEPMPQRPGDMPNYPASEWDTPQLKQLHTQDIFTDTRKEAAVSTAGGAWRFEAVADDNDPQVIYFLWRKVTDIDTIAVKEQLTDVASDGKLSGGAEKSRVYTDWMRCVDEYNKYYAQRNLYDVSSQFTAFQTAFLALGAYLNDGDPLTTDPQTGQYSVPAWISASTTMGLLVTTDIDPVTWQQTWNAYHQAVTDLANAIRQAAKTQVDNLADDGIISEGYEKSMLLVEWMKAVAEYNKAMESSSIYTSSYTIVGVPTISTDALTTATKALCLMLDGGNPSDSAAVSAFDLSSYIRTDNPERPLWIGSDIGTDTVIESPLTVAIYQNVWTKFYTELADLNSKRMQKMILGVNATFENTGTSLVSRVTGTELTLYDHQDGSGTTIKGLVTITSEHTVSLGSITSEITSARGSYSSLSLKLDSITSTVADNKSAADSAFATLNNTVIPGLSDRITSAQSTADGAATWISQNKNRIALIASQFDASGNLTNTSGLVTSAGTGANAFSTLFATAYDNTGAATTMSTLRTDVDSVTSEVTSARGSYSTLSLKLDSITSTVADNKSAADSAFATLNNTVIPGLSDRITSAQSTADGAATWISQNKNRIALIASQFDASGNLTNTSGLVTTSGYASLFTQNMNSKGVVTSANIGTYTSSFVDANGVEQIISNAEISGDNIDFTFTQTAKFKARQNGSDVEVLCISPNGDLWIKGEYKGGSVTGAMNIGSSNAQRKFVISPSDSSGRATISGYDGSTEVVKLGWTYSDPHPVLTMENGGTIAVNDNSMRQAAVSPGSFSVSNGYGSFYVNLQSNSSLIQISAINGLRFPTEAEAESFHQDTGVHEVFKDNDGYLRYYG